MQELLNDISLSVQKVYTDAIDGIREKFAFEKRPTAGEIKGAPTVLLLGNHSSGKSSFINYLLADDVQKTGLAPTDDGFTILTRGEISEERDGKAIVSNPELPYDGLQHFGDEFLAHFRMKVRSNDFLKDVTLIDTPGMIDAAKEDSGRGYDFSGAVRWFAERADVVLVFFDPDKPGTTGETLHVFTQSLQGIDHKLLIVLNKVDQFRSVQDFARAYGALCWNLGKVIARKDLPTIYTTYVPLDDMPTSDLPIGDFDASRDELVHEIKRAPARRVDNMLTQLNDHAQRLRMHAEIVHQAARDLRKFRFHLWSLVIFVVLLLAGAGALGTQHGEPPMYWSFFGGALFIGLAGYYLNGVLVRAQERQIIAGLPDVFERVYARDLLVRDRAEDLQYRWESIHPRTRRTMEKLGLLSFPRLKSAELSRLMQTLDHDIPDLRKKLHREMGVTASR